MTLIMTDGFIFYIAKCYILLIYIPKESIVSMLEQLPGAHQLKQYSFKYNPPFDISSLEGTAEQVRGLEKKAKAPYLF